MKKVDFDEYTENYNQLLREKTGFFSEDEAYFASYKVSILKSRLVDSRHILEFGCGIGRNIPFLKSAFVGATIEGSDVSEQSLQLARSANPGVTFWREGDHADHPKKFDLIFVAGVFHHIPPAERDAVVAALFDRLVPAGDVFIFEHNPYNPITRKIVSNCPFDEDVILLKPKELIRRLESGGFHVIKREFALFFPPRLKFLLGLERGMGWLPLGGQYWVHARRP